MEMKRKERKAHVEVVLLSCVRVAMCMRVTRHKFDPSRHWLAAPI
jgi:hypothetical protein